MRWVTRFLSHCVAESTGHLSDVTSGNRHTLSFLIGKAHLQSDIRANDRTREGMVAEKLQIPRRKIQLFWHKKELAERYDTKTLLDMNLHTGFSLRGYDLVKLSQPCS